MTPGRPRARPLVAEPSASFPARRLGLVLNGLTAVVCLAIAVGFAGLGVYYIFSESDGGFSDGLGNALGLFAVVAGATVAAGCLLVLWAVQKHLTVDRNRSRDLARWVLADLVGAAGTGWFLRETFRTAAGDGHAVNPFYVAAWVIQGAVFAAAALALYLSNRPAERN